jgi:hypothetical protein
LEMFLQFAKHMKVQGSWVRAVQWVRWGPEMASVAGQLLRLAGPRKSHCMLWQVAQQVWTPCGKTKDWCPKTSTCFSSPLTSNHLKKIANLTFWSSLYTDLSFKTLSACKIR